MVPLTTSDPCSPKDQQASVICKPLTYGMKNAACDLLLPEEQSILKAIPQYSMVQAEVRSDWPLLMHCVSISLVTSSVLSELSFFKRCHVWLLMKKTFSMRFDLVCSCIWREATSWKRRSDPFNSGGLSMKLNDTLITACRLRERKYSHPGTVVFQVAC